MVFLGGRGVLAFSRSRGQEVEGWREEKLPLEANRANWRWEERWSTRVQLRQTHGAENMPMLCGGCEDEAGWLMDRGQKNVGAQVEGGPRCHGVA